MRSADKPDSLRGVSMDFLVMDECAMIDQVMWTEVCRPALSDKRGSALFITTPKGMNWIYDLYEGAAHLDDWGRYQFTTLDGGNVPEDEIEAAKRELDEKSFRQEYMATFETYSGLIYYNWSAERNIIASPPPIDPRQILHVGMDFNVDPLVASIATVSSDMITIFDEVVINGSNTHEICEEITRRYPNNRIYAYPDASGQARKTSSKTTDHAIMRNAGFTLKVKGVNPPVLDRIASVNASLLSADKETVRLHVTPNCKNVINSLSKQTYKEGTRIPLKDGKIDHMSDAVGYLVHWINPLRSQTPVPQQPGMFGHF